jgi:S-adenosyl-L-methionine hydrolase (adenosine-forming)
VPHPLGLITLLTDFGDRDYFVASMKGVILTINPSARIVDLSHRIAPHRIEEARYFLKSCYRYFPEGTVHVAVVDPGVGTARRPLLVSTSRYFFIAPDNGLLSDLLQQETGVEVRQIENKQYCLDKAGSSFDGRDLFAPAAAWLSNGVPPALFGQLIHDLICHEIAKPRWEDQRLVGQIVYVDRFGNLISNLTTHHLKEFREVTTRPSPLIHIADHTIGGLVGSYSEGDAEVPNALINSNDYLEVFLKEGSATELLKLRVAEPIKLE